MRAAPYPADTRAKGWRFELDHERIRQSDTWALAPADIKPWLLMLWMTAWEQTPCGSLPAVDELVAARIGMPMKTFAKHRHCLMRGWWTADDGRLYHDTLVERVLEMTTAKDKERNRKAEWRARHAGKTAASDGSPDLSHGTTTGQTGDSHGIDPVRDGTGTGTGTGTSSSLRSEESPERASAGAACKAMKTAGLADVNPSHPKLSALLAAGISVAELTDAAVDAAKRKKPFAYALATAEGRRRDAATKPLPAAAAADPDSRSSVEAEGIAKGIGPWNELSEQWMAYRARVRAAPGQKPFDLNALAGLAAQRTGAH
jgi:hypothetical protein